MDACQLCDFMITRTAPLRQSRRVQKVSNSRFLTTVTNNPPQSTKFPKFSRRSGIKPICREVGDAAEGAVPRIVSQEELDKAFLQVKATCDAILRLNHAPTEQEVVNALGHCNTLAELIVLDCLPAPASEKTGAASALLSLDEPATKKISAHKISADILRKLNELSKLAYLVVKSPPVFITPQVLELYVKLQASLEKPETFPEVFTMYANKPLPREGSISRYSKQNPNKVSNAIPIATADRALQVAINARQLVVAIDIVESAYTTKAFHRAKFVRKGLLPATGMAVAPLAAYTIASQFALLQNSMDSAMATNVAFAGILAYTFFTGTIGVVAITTANDQMDRVTWAPGMPLRERWIREEERAAMDKIAGAWGFRETWRRGEEEGEDWDALREWIGGKGMMLDRVELMEGME